MNKDKSNLNVPCLRFKEFNNPWDLKQIKDILNYQQPTKFIIQKDKIKNQGPTPVLTANKSLILGYVNEKNSYENIPAIIFDDFTMDMKYVNFKFMVKSSAIKILKSKNNNINLFYVFNLLKNLKLSSTVHKRYYISYVSEINVLLPNINEQNKIAQFFAIIDKQILEQKTLIAHYQSLLKIIKNVYLQFMIQKNNIKKYSFSILFIKYKLFNHQLLQQFTIGKNGIKLLETKSNYSTMKHIVFNNNSLIIGLGVEEIGVSINQMGCCSPIYSTYKINENVLYPKFLFYFANKLLCSNISQISKTSTRRKFEIDVKTLCKINLFLPQLHEQISISKKLDSYNDLISISEKLLDNLNNLKLYLFNNLFI